PRPKRTNRIRHTAQAIGKESPRQPRAQARARDEKDERQRRRREEPEPANVAEHHAGTFSQNVSLPRSASDSSASAAVSGVAYSSSIFSVFGAVRRVFSSASMRPRTSPIARASVARKNSPPVVC